MSELGLGHLFRVRVRVRVRNRVTVRVKPVLSWQDLCSESGCVLIDVVRLRVTGRVGTGFGVKLTGVFW